MSAVVPLSSTVARSTRPSASTAGLAGIAAALAIFLLYTNLPVVLAEQGIVPGALAGAVPLLLAAAVAHQVVIQRRRIVVDRTLVLMLVLLGIMVVGAFTAEGYSVALLRIRTFVGEGVAIYFLVRNGIRTLPELRTAVVSILLASCLLSGLAVVQAVTGSYEQDFFGLAKRSLEHLEDAPASAAEGLGDEDRAGGPVGEPNRFAQILLMAAPLAFVLSKNARRRKHAVAAAGCLILILLGVLVTYSRGAFLTLVVLAMIAAGMRVVRAGHLASILVCGALLVPVVAPGYVERIGSISGVAGLFGSAEVEADGPTQGRTTEMLSALAAYLEHPVIGVGPGQYLPYYSVHYQALPEISIRDIPEPRRAHNLYLEMAAETGTLGLLVFLAIPLLLLRDLRVLRIELAERQPDLSRWAAGCSLAVFAYLGTGVFLHLAFERYYWLMIGLTAAGAGIVHQRLHSGYEGLLDELPDPAPTFAGEARC